MDSERPSWPQDFPIREEFEDFTGKLRAFVIECHERPLGYTVRAREDRPASEGYEFAAYSETSPYSALGRVREKARRSMATRHLSQDREMLHDTLRGRISWGRESGVQLVVDGLAVGMEELAEFLSSREGWEFELRIQDGLR